jgi:cell division protein ZapA
MGQVIIAVNDRSYTMQCADGEEAQLSTLAGVLDKEVGLIRDQVGAVGDLRLLLMAGLMLADKLAEAERNAEAMREQIEGLRQSRSDALIQGRSLEEQLAERLDEASERLEELAMAFNGS